MIMYCNKSSVISELRNFGDLIYFIQLRSLTPPIRSDFIFLLVLCGLLFSVIQVFDGHSPL